MIPDPLPLPLPGPVLLLKVLLVGGWMLHALPMNLILAGTIVTVLTDCVGLLRNSPFHQALARRLSLLLPVAAALTITFGIVPLLFLQVLYPQSFFTSSILMGWPWLSIIVAIVVAYYGLYLYALQANRLGRRRIWIAMTSSLLFLWVGFMFTNNSTLMNLPEEWFDAYVKPPLVGLYLPVLYPATIPRFIHILVGATATTGLGIAVYGLALQWRSRQRDIETRRVIRYGLGWALLALIAQAATGPVLLLSFPSSVQAPFLGGSTRDSLVLATGVALGVAATFALLFARRSRNPLIAVVAAGLLLLPTIASMATMRQLVRQAYLGGRIDPDTRAVEFQVGPFLIFAVGLAIAVLLIIFIVYKLILGPPPSQPADDSSLDTPDS